MKNKNLRLYASFLTVTIAFLVLIGLSIAARNEERVSLEASVFNGTDGYKETEKTLPEYLVPMGTVFGIKLYTEGVIVSAIENISTKSGAFSPAFDAGIRAGDFIIEAEGEFIDNNKELSALIKNDEDGKIELLVKRDGGFFKTQLDLIKYEGSYKAGMWIRDSAAGIGTLTYYNPATGEFGGLGHGICDVEAGKVMTVKEGQPENIVISDIVKGESGVPGRLSGYFAGEGPLGEISKNCETGIYGKLNFIPEGEKMKLLKKEEISVGKAEIICTVDNSAPVSYDIEIVEIINDSRKVKNMVIKITDEYLLNKTGGIIQGLSGSPIIQNGKLAGAVTHVFLDNPQMGYGIFIGNMLSAAE